LPRDQNQALG